MRTAAIAPLLLGLAALVLSACGPIHSVTLGRSGDGNVHRDHGHGPPPHAPAHGYRRNACNVPTGHLPPPGECRVWHPALPFGQQPPPGDCYELRRHVPPGACLVHGE